MAEQPVPQVPQPPDNAKYRNYRNYTTRNRKSGTETALNEKGTGIASTADPHKVLVPGGNERYRLSTSFYHSQHITGEILSSAVVARQLFANQLPVS